VPVEQEVHATVFALGVPNQPDGQHAAQPGGPRIAAVLSDRTRERALERMRADFVANASHELRTPLASLIGFIDTLRGPAADDPPAQARFLQIMADQAKRMNRLIDDLLSLSRIELIEHQPPSGRVALPDLVRWVAAAFEPQVTARRQDLQVTVPAELPPVPGDEDQLAQVLHNLLENAVKYGREGGTLRLTASVVPPGGRWPARPGMTLAVSDDGQGIAPEHLPRLTERFYRVDRGRSRAVGGTGLGLAIVKHIVNRHRGQLAIESREGEGSTFTVWLPMAVSRRNGDGRDPAGTWTPAGGTRPMQPPRSPRPSPR
jgi:two-component system phosphate regulon sensor histidine kinase PhoR